MDNVHTELVHTRRGEVILQLAFNGDHWQHGNEIGKVIANALEASAPAAIALDLSKFRYHGGDYVEGFLAAFVADKHRISRPACFVRAPSSMQTAFELFRLNSTLGIRYFDSNAEALDYLGSRLESSNERTEPRKDGSEE
jgi:hypothetical protein